MDTVIFLSGTTRGATLEGAGRSLGRVLTERGLRFIEISLLNVGASLDVIRTLNFREVKMVFSWVSMGMEFTLQREDGKSFDLWQETRVPFVSIHGDSPAYFFDRHVVKDSKYVTIYSFTEHLELRRRLPHVHGPIEVGWPIPLDEVSRDEIDFAAKKNGKLLFLKNGKDPAYLRRFWASCLEPRLLSSIMDLAIEFESDLDSTAIDQIDDAVGRYFADARLDIERLFKLRLFFIAQLDDYIRAVKCTRMAEALMDFPVEVRGNNWGHLDFTGKRATYIDDCDYARSIGLVRGSLGLIDMSPNTRSRPHDRVARAFGAHTLCVTNEQDFLDELPHGRETGFRFERGCLQERIAQILADKSAAIEMGIANAAAYRKHHPPEDTVAHLLDSAAAVRLDSLQHRPAGSQDFFVWPPIRL